MSLSTDCRGIPRGNCSVCGCDQYDGGAKGMKCSNCSHPPGKHLNMKTGFASLSPVALTVHPSLLTPTSMDDGLCMDDGVSRSVSQPTLDLSTDLDYDADNEDLLPSSMITDDLCTRIHSASSVSLSSSHAKQPSVSQSVFQSVKSVFAPKPKPRVPVVRSSAFQQQQVVIGQDQQCLLGGCNKKKYTESQTGYVHDFCSRTHAKKYEELNCQVSPELRCKTPGCFRQRYLTDQGQYFDYCTKFCRDHGGKPLEPMQASVSSPNIALTSDNRCIFPGCLKAKYHDPANGRTHDYCGRTHAYKAREQGITGVNNGIRVATHQECSTITKTFQQKWAAAKGPCPAVTSVYVITNTPLYQRWQKYQNGLQKKDVEQFYHGTKLTCNITATSVLCNDPACGVCGISSTGLDRRCIRQNIPFQRFGHGFYLAPNSSKCHDYTQGSHSFRAMLVFDVCPGNKYALKSDNEKLKGPPQGFDSVHGQAGSRLNYDELVVYNPDAALPKYIVVYQKDGEKKIAK